MPPPAALRELAREFDTLFVDVWGVLHVGEGPLPGVVDALRSLRDAGRRVILLTNTSRLGPAVTATLVSLGIDASLFSDVVTAGDVTREAIVNRDPALFGGLPERPRCLHVGAPEFVPWLFELGFDLEASAAEAELVFATGAVGSADALAEIADALRPAARRRVPLVCTNPDRVIPTARGPKLGPGAVADAYAEEGAPTFAYGKPHPAIYAEARRRAGEAVRILAIGDRIETDIAGARAAGLPSALVGAVPEDARVTPDFVLPAFAW